MLRKVVGWIRHASEEWETVMHNMKVRVDRAMDQFYVRSWAQRILGARRKNFERIAVMDCNRWEQMSIGWDPRSVIDDSQDFVAHRRAGRPLIRWTDEFVNE